MPPTAPIEPSTDSNTPEAIETAIRRAKSQASKFVAKLPNWMDHDAYFGEALLAVALAIQDYDPRHGTAFQSWSHTKVWYALREEQRRQDPVGRVRRARITSGETAEEPTDLLPLSFEQLRADRGERLDRDLTGHAPSAEELALQSLESRALTDAISRLPLSEATVIRLRFFEALSQSTIARRLQCTEHRVKQLETAALSQLRQMLPPGDDR